MQAKLAGNALDRRAGNGATEPSLLAGILHDECGNRLSPSHAVKNGVRYRYYVSQALLQNRDSDAGSIVRIPAREIEELIVARIAALFKDSGQVIDELADSLSPRDQERLMVAGRNQAERWLRMRGSEQRAFVLRIVASVTVSEREIRIVLGRNGLRHTLLDDESSIDLAGPPRSQPEAPASGDALTLRVPTRLKLCSGEMRLVIPPGSAREMRPRINAALIKALTRAHKWKHKLFSGQAPSISAIANEEGMTERYVGRIIRLAFLAPDIVEAILDGYQPGNLELERLMKVIPIGWQEQRRVLGFSRG